MPKPFQLLIKPVGAACNMRCAYCFYLRAAELFPDDPHPVMPEEVLETMVRGYMGLRFPESVFAWQGGEPTVAGVGFFRKVVEFQQKYGLSGQVVGNGFQTNGLLIDEEWCRLFRDYRFLVGLSLDGPESVHDRVRLSVGGKATWARTMAAAELMRAHDIAFNVLCVIHAGNVGMGADLIRWFMANGFDYLQFIPCMEPDNPHNVSPDIYAKFLCEAFDFWSREALGKVSIRDFDAILGAKMGAQPMCIFARACNSYIVVEHNGEVFPCDFFVYDEWRLGNVMNASMESFMQTDKYKTFAHRKDKVNLCRACEWRAQCYGGCQKDRLAAEVSGSPTPFCKAYQQFFRHSAPKWNALMKRAQRG